ncbi:MAG: FAD-dependent oxidoreductase [Saprospiraceae bacterium]
MPVNYHWSHWEYNTFFKNIDYCVIGSGIVGLSTAIHLKQKLPKAKILILERGPLPIGASTRNAGFACFGSMTELLEDLESRNADEVWSLVEQRYQGLLLLRQVLGDEAIRYLPEGGYELFTKEQQETYERCLDHLTTFNQQLAKITGHKQCFKTVNDQLPNFGMNKVKYLILNQAEGSIDTGSMMRSFLQKAQELGVFILNNAEVIDIEETQSRVNLRLQNDWEIQAKQIVIATNGFSKQLLPAQAILPARNLVLITQPIPDLKIKGCFHYDRGYFYFRNVGDRLLLGGGRHLAKETETSTSFQINPLIQDALKKLLAETILPQQKVEIERWWTGILGIGAQKTPILERISDRQCVAIRLGGMGVAIGTLLGANAAELAISS